MNKEDPMRQTVSIQQDAVVLTLPRPDRVARRAFGWWWRSWARVASDLGVDPTR